MHGRSQMTRHAEWQHSGNSSSSLSHLDFPFFGMSRCPRSLVAHIPWCWSRVTSAEWKWKFGSPMPLFRILSLPAARLRPNKTVNPNICTLSIITLTWYIASNCTLWLNISSTGLIFCNNGSCIWNLFDLRSKTTGLILLICYRVINL